MKMRATRLALNCLTETEASNAVLRRNGDERVGAGRSSA